MTNTEKFQLAQQAFLNHDYRQAGILATELYMEKKTLRTNRFLFKVLIKEKRYEDAYNLASDYLQEYIQNNDWLEEYIETGVWAGKSILIEQLLIQINPYMKRNEQKKFEKACALSNYWCEKKEYLKKIERKLRYLGSLSFNEQRVIYQQSYALSKNDWKKNIGELLENEDVHIFLRVTILDDLRKLKITDELVFLNIQGLRNKVVPANFLSLEDTEVYNYYQDYFKTRVEKGDILASTQWDDFKLKLMLLYPDFKGAKKVLGEYKKWYALFKDSTHRNDDVSDFVDKLEENILIWQTLTK